MTGFEFACGIPGSVGGAVFMNAGAYGGEIAHILQSCKILTKDGEIETLSAKDLASGIAIQPFKSLVQLSCQLNLPLLQEAIRLSSKKWIA